MLFESLPRSSDPLIVLRPIIESDLPTWFEYLTRPGVLDHTSWNLAAQSELSRNVWSDESRTASSPLRFAIALRATGHLIGAIGFPIVWAEHRSAEIAFDLSPDFQGKGIATTACRMLVGWAHDEVGLVRVQAVTLDSNLRSAAVLNRAGFVREGLMRSYRIVRGDARDFHMHAHVVSRER